MLVPLLAMPFHHPLANMLVQGWIMTLAALLAAFHRSRDSSPDATAPGWRLGRARTRCFCLFTTPAVQFDWLVTQPYGFRSALGSQG